MTDLRILVTRRLPDAVEAALSARFAVTLRKDDRRWNGTEILRNSEGHDAILCTVGDDLSTDVIAALPPSLRLIATFSVGYNHIDFAAAAQRGIIVTNTPDVLTDATADIAVLLMLGATRRLKEGMALLASGGWEGWAPTQLMGRELAGKRLGLLGYGRIARAVRARASAFGMICHAFGGRPGPNEHAEVIRHDTLSGFLASVDVLSLHAPLTDQTRGIINAETLACLPQGAILINTARGELVDDDALIAALNSGQIGAAGLDVYAGEPSVNERYLTLPNVLALPHLGSATVETRVAMGMRALENLAAFAEGRVPTDTVVFQGAAP